MERAFQEVPDFRGGDAQLTVVVTLFPELMFNPVATCSRVTPTVNPISRFADFPLEIVQVPLSLRMRQEPMTCAPIWPPYFSILTTLYDTAAASAAITGPSTRPRVASAPAMYASSLLLLVVIDAPFHEIVARGIGDTDDPMVAWEESTAWVKRQIYVQISPSYVPNTTRLSVGGVSRYVFSTDLGRPSPVRWLDGGLSARAPATAASRPALRRRAPR